MADRYVANGGAISDRPQPAAGIPCCIKYQNIATDPRFAVFHRHFQHVGDVHPAMMASEKCQEQEDLKREGVRRGCDTDEEIS